MRAIWSAWETGDKLDFRGDFYTHTLMTPMFRPVSEQPPPKVLLAAVGERMTEAAGAVADGLLLHAFTTQRYLREVTLPVVQRARLAAGRNPDEAFEIVCSAFVVTGRTEQELAASRTAVRERIAFYASTPAYRPVLALDGWGELGDELNALSKSPERDKWQQMGARISDDVLDAFAVIGEPDAIGDRVRERFEGLITRYDAGGTGLNDAGLDLQVALSIKNAFQATH
jgi:probable F420-dependent oxidoreductase